jgi:hypothetical protein
MTSTTDRGLVLEDALVALQGIATYAGAARREFTTRRADPDLLDVLRVVEDEARSALITPSMGEAPSGAPATTSPAVAGARARALAPPRVVTRQKAAELLLDPPPLVERMRVFDLLRLVPDLSHDGARRLLRSTMIGEQRRIGSLSLRGERLVLASQLRDDTLVTA